MNFHHHKVNITEIIDLIKQTEKIIFDEAAVSDITVKGAADFVTRVDTAVQDFLQKELGDRYPQIGFIGEEQASFIAEPKGDYWILDPIDGTTNLIHHYNLSAVSLGLYEAGKITMGIVYNPFTKEMFTAVEGQGAYLNGGRIQVSDIDNLENAVVAYGSCPYDKGTAHEMFALFERIFLHCADFRRTGSAALDLCYIACGRQDGYLEQNLKPWDYAAGSLILQEAGGMVGDWNKDKSLPYLKNADIFATNGKIEEELRRLL